MTEPRHDDDHDPGQDGDTEEATRIDVAEHVGQAGDTPRIDRGSGPPRRSHFVAEKSRNSIELGPYQSRPLCFPLPGRVSIADFVTQRDPRMVAHARPRSANSGGGDSGAAPH
jgi:hypothetical protein